MTCTGLAEGQSLGNFGYIEILLGNALTGLNRPEEGTRLLRKSAVAHIPDEPTRQSFLENVSWHQQIMLAKGERMFYN